MRASMVVNEKDEHDSHVMSTGCMPAASARATTALVAVPEGPGWDASIAAANATAAGRASLSSHDRSSSCALSKAAADDTVAPFGSVPQAVPVAVVNCCSVCPGARPLTKARSAPAPMCAYHSSTPAASAVCPSCTPTNSGPVPAGWVDTTAAPAILASARLSRTRNIAFLLCDIYTHSRWKKNRT